MAERDVFGGMEWDWIFGGARLGERAPKSKGNEMRTVGCWVGEERRGTGCRDVREGGVVW